MSSTPDRTPRHTTVFILHDLYGSSWTLYIMKMKHLGAVCCMCVHLALLISHLFLISHLPRLLKEKKRLEFGHVIIVESNMVTISGRYSLSETTSTILAIVYIHCMYMIWKKVNISYFVCFSRTGREVWEGVGTAELPA